MNRIAYSIQVTRKKIDLMEPSKIANLEKTLKDLSTGELFLLQEKKSQAQAMGIISLEEALTIYNALNDWEHQDLATKSMVYVGMDEIVKKLRR